MGHELTAAVAAAGVTGRTARVSHSARLALFGMAAVAHDTGTKTKPRAQYWGGWEWLARAMLGYAEYDAAARAAVARAVRELIDAGLIKQVGRLHGERHGNAVYELTL
jgi:hypothetical protein